eukprot:6370512-Pyramimonas_sp.AAC.1
MVTVHERPRTCCHSPAAAGKTSRRASDGVWSQTDARQARAPCGPIEAAHHSGAASRDSAAGSKTR